MASSPDPSPAVWLLAGWCIDTAAQGQVLLRLKQEAAHTEGKAEQVWVVLYNVAVRFDRHLEVADLLDSMCVSPLRRRDDDDEGTRDINCPVLEQGLRNANEALLREASLEGPHVYIWTLQQPPRAEGAGCVVVGDASFSRRSSAVRTSLSEHLLMDKGWALPLAVFPLHVSSRGRLQQLLGTEEAGADNEPLLPHTLGSDDS